MEKKKKATEAAPVQTQNFFKGKGSDCLRDNKIVFSNLSNVRKGGGV